MYRFGSFEIFKQEDEYTGRQGPSYGLDSIRTQMLDYVIETFYPEIQQSHSDTVERNTAFFREVRCLSQRIICVNDYGYMHSEFRIRSIFWLGQDPE